MMQLTSLLFTVAMNGNGRIFYNVGQAEYVNTKQHY